MGFRSVRELVDAYDAGQTRVFSWRKVPAVSTAAGYWLDLSMSPGNPRPNYYASTPFISAPLAQSTDGGMFHGADLPSPCALHIHTISALATGGMPMPLTLCDYLLYYPFIDESDPDPQLLTNSVPLPRYESGEGVRMMAVVVAPHQGTGATFNVNYTNSKGVAGRTTQTVRINMGQFVNGTVLSAAPASTQCIGPFIPLQNGDTGVRSIESVTVLSPGDVGLFTLVLIKPLLTMCLRGVGAPVEVDFCKDRPLMPQVLNNAYLNFLAYPAASVSGVTVMGTTHYVWSS